MKRILIVVCIGLQSLAALASVEYYLSPDTGSTSNSGLVPASPRKCSTAAELDTAMKDIATATAPPTSQVIIHMTGGTGANPYLINGIGNGNPSGGWLIQPNWVIQGDGASTVIKMDDYSAASDGHVFILASTAQATSIQVRDLTVDCNWTAMFAKAGTGGYPNDLTTAGVSLDGRNHLIHGVKVINAGTHSATDPNYEGFPIQIGGLGSPYGANIIEHCTVSSYKEGPCTAIIIHDAGGTVQYNNVDFTGTTPVGGLGGIGGWNHTNVNYLHNTIIKATHGLNVDSGSNEGIVVAGNEFQGISNYGIVLTAPLKGVLIANNSIQLAGTSYGGDGITIGSSVSQVAVFNNVFSSTSSVNGAAFNISSSALPQTVIGNTFGDKITAPSGDILIAPSLQIGDGTGDSAPIAKVLSKTASLTYSFVAGGALAVDHTITVSGAALGDVVALGVPNAAVTGVISYYGWVSAANTVTIRSTLAISATRTLTGTFRAVVSKF